MKLPENRTTLLSDIFFCLIFMPLLVFLGPAHYWIREWPVLFCLAMAFLYGCYFLLKAVNVPRLLVSRRYWRLAALVLFLVACNLAIIHFPLPDMDFVTPAMSRYQTNIRDYGITIGMWLMFAFVMAYALTSFFLQALYGQILLRRRIESQRDKAQLAMFRAQISPHFLFNTLNSLYSLVIGTSQKAEDAFIKFTDILKYTYISIDNESVPLEDEVTYIDNYIDLQMLRLNDNTTVLRKISISMPGAVIPPMILLTFVENAFKYGSSTSHPCVIEMSLSLSDRGVLHLHTRNRIMKHADEFRTTMPVGLQNCRERLAALYPGRHTLDVTDTGEYFTVDLTINLEQPMPL